MSDLKSIEALKAEAKAKEAEIKAKLAELKAEEESLKRAQRAPGAIARNMHDFEKSSARFSVLAAVDSEAFGPYFELLARAHTAFCEACEETGFESGGIGWQGAKPEDVKKFDEKGREASSNFESFE